MPWFHIQKISQNPQKATRAKKWIQYNCRKQDQHINISCVSIHQQWIIQKEIKKIPFRIAWKRMKCLVHRYTENYKTLLKEIKEDTNGQPGHGLENLILLKYTKWCTDSVQSLSKSQWFFFYGNRKIHPQIHMESRGTL